MSTEFSVLYVLCVSQNKKRAEEDKCASSIDGGKNFAIVMIGFISSCYMVRI